MKKLIAALLVLTMVLALTGSAMAASICVGDYVKFTKNSYGYDAPHSYKRTSDPEVIVHKGSIGEVVAKKNGYYKIRLTLNTNDALWFKKGDVKLSKASPITGDVLVVFSNGGNGYSKPIPGSVVKDTINTNKCHVKATAKVWMHYTPSLSNSYGKALHKDDKVKYRHVIGLDTRGVPFFGIRYSGKNLFVSSAYSKLVK
ncbi:MAG: hypothetical protein IJI71_17200 [Clostridia bacterium]|nr:hypothetical protein [Clostridia bacterium]